MDDLIAGGVRVWAEDLTLESGANHGGDPRQLHALAGGGHSDGIYDRARDDVLYDHLVSESYTVAHLQPRTDARQYCTNFSLQVSPAASLRSYIDRFGNIVHHFAILPAHGSLSVVARSHVVTTAGARPVDPVSATRPASMLIRRRATGSITSTIARTCTFAPRCRHF